MAFLTLVLARSQDVPPSRSIGGFEAPSDNSAQIRPLDRDEQLVLAVVSQPKNLLHAVADPDLLQTDEHADAVVHVHDVVADLEVAQIREKRFAGSAPLGSASFLLEDIRLGVDLEASVGKAEAAGERADAASTEAYCASSAVRPVCERLHSPSSRRVRPGPVFAATARFRHRRATA